MKIRLFNESLKFSCSKNRCKTCCADKMDSLDGGKWKYAIVKIRIKKIMQKI